MAARIVSGEPQRESCCASRIPSGMLLAFLLSILVSSLTASKPAYARDAVESGQLCWSSAALRSRPDEAVVVQRVRRAFLNPPEAQPRSASSARISGGVVRRVKLPPGQKLVALTFDLCEQPHEVAGYQGHIVDTLRDRNVRATFFIGGKWMLSHPERSQQLMADPLFEVATHTWEHRNLRLLAVDPQKTQALRTEIIAPLDAYEAIREDLLNRKCLARNGAPVAALTQKTLDLFRFPFGACNKEALAAVNAAGLTAIQWDVSSGDPWIGQTADQMIVDVLHRVQPGSIVLFHANGRGWHTPSALPAIIEGLTKRGYKFVTVSELLRAGEPVVASTCYDSRPGDTDHYDALAKKLEVTYARARAEVLGREVAPKTASRPAVPAMHHLPIPKPKMGNATTAPSPPQRALTVPAEEPQLVRLRPSPVSDPSSEAKSAHQPAVSVSPGTDSNQSSPLHSSKEKPDAAIVPPKPIPAARPSTRSPEAVRAEGSANSSNLPAPPHSSEQDTLRSFAPEGWRAHVQKN